MTWRERIIEIGLWRVLFALRFGDSVQDAAAYALELMAMEATEVA